MPAVQVRVGIIWLYNRIRLVIVLILIQKRYKVGSLRADPGNSKD